MSSSPATIRDVAKVAGLSVASVSRVLNGLPGVNAATRDKVLHAVESLAYVPNAAARSLSTAKSHAIGVVLPDLHGEFFSELVRGMDRAATAQGYLLLLSNMHADPKLAGQALSAMRGRVDGLIVMAPQLTVEDRQRTLPGGLPVVLVNSPDDDHHPGLRVGNAAGVRAVVRHLAESGRRRIVHLSGASENLDSQERRTAYMDALRDTAPDFEPMVLEGDFSEASGEALTLQLLDGSHPFDAIFAANDMMALGALQALRARGLSVPEDVAVVGFDDIPLARYMGLTTLRVDMVGIGHRAVTRLIERIERPPFPAGELQQLSHVTELSQVELVVRATTGGVTS